MILALAVGCSGAEPVDSDPPSTPVDTGSLADDAACQAYERAFVDVSEGVFTGDISSCDPGSFPEAAAVNALRVLNYSRTLAGVPPVTRDAAGASGAQECALMMHANDTLSHGPPDDWDCYTATGGEAAAVGLLAREPAVGAVGQYLVDFGNETTLVHRRWLLNGGLPSVAFGSTDAFSCLRLGSTVLDSEGWVAWPPPGRVPLALMVSPGNSDVDTEGWSIQSDALDLSGAEVTVTVDGEAFVQTPEVLVANQGSLSAIRFVPDGFSSTPGTYEVAVTGVAEPFSYSVVFVECG